MRQFFIPNSLLLFMCLLLLSVVVSPSVFAQEVEEWECRIEGSNDGCEKSISAPSGKRIVGVTAACNLEFHAVSNSELESVPANTIKVVKKSDYRSDYPSGYCYVNDTKIYDGEETIDGINGINQVVVGCFEHDQNGGDCHIRGTLTLEDSTGTTSNEIGYTPSASDDPILNPERGFYRHPTECNLPGFYDQLGTYRNEDNPGESYSLVICIYYLPKEPSSSEAFQNALLDLQAKAAAVRAAGLKMILRFAYTDKEAGDDVPLDTVEEHIDALASTLQNHSDVIAVVQSGFVGAWGEGAYSDYFGDAGSEDWDSRERVIEKLLEVVPSNRIVQVRRPEWKRIWYGENPVSEEAAHEDTPLARVGHHNDCFLRNELDAGTYEEPNVEKPYLEGDTTYVPMGGETCPPPNPPRSECGDGNLDVHRDPASGDLNDLGQFVNTDLSTEGGGDALEELKRFHYSYLNLDWSPAVLNTWDSECMETVKNSLGYRLSLVSSDVPDSFYNVDQGVVDITVQIRIQNTGWAAPFNPRPVYIVFRNTVSNEEFKLPFDEDLRQWVPGTGEGNDKNLFTLSKRFQFKDTSTQGSHQDDAYKLFLSFPDPLLEDEPEYYSIRLANVDSNGRSLWDPSTGYNDLLRTETAEYLEP